MITLITESPRTSPQQDFPMEGVNGPPLPPFTNPHFKDGNHSANSTTRELPTVSLSRTLLSLELLDIINNDEIEFMKSSQTRPSHANILISLMFELIVLKTIHDLRLSTRKKNVQLLIMVLLSEEHDKNIFPIPLVVKNFPRWQIA